MNTEHVPKKYSVADQQQWYEKMAERAYVAKLTILLQSLYFVVIVGSFDMPRDREMFGVEGLPVGPAFGAAGLAGLVALAAMRGLALAEAAGHGGAGARRATMGVITVWLALAGLACCGRTLSVLCDTSDNFTLNERLKATGWIVQWLASLLATVQILAARALRGRRVWTG